MDKVFKKFKNQADHISGLEDFMLNIDDGEIFGLLGSNGSGKTTIINLITGTIIPDSGNIRVFGKTPLQASQKISVCQQHDYLI